MTITMAAAATNITQSLPPQAESGVKYACASCIRGHRTSSCTHLDGSKGPLLAVRGKGRPPTQCEVCRLKRKTSGRHVRCDCHNSKKTSMADSKAVTHKAQLPRPILPASENKRRRISLDEPTTPPDVYHILPWHTIPIQSPWDQRRQSAPFVGQHLATPSFDRAAALDTDVDLPTRSSLTLSSLMNPCGCNSTRSCACCRDKHKRHSNASIAGSTSSSSRSDDGVCDATQCGCDPVANATKSTSPSASVRALTAASEKGSDGCCSKAQATGTSAPSVPSIELLLKAVDMSADFEPPQCACGDDCRCARCLGKSVSRGKDADVAVEVAQPNATTGTAEGCDDCAACDLALERPSGIGAVDAWLDKDRRTVATSESSSQLNQPQEEQQQQQPTQPAVAINDSLLRLHGGLLTPQPKAAGVKDTLNASDTRAELVTLHPNCAACMTVVRSKGVGVLSSVSTSD